MFGATRTGLVASSSWTTIPGLTINVNLERDAIVHMMASGVIRALVFDSNYCHQAYRFVVNGDAEGDPTHGQRLQVHSRDLNWWQMWNFSFTVSLPAGLLSVEVQTRESSNATAMCVVCGEANGALPEYTTCDLNLSVVYQ